MLERDLEKYLVKQCKQRGVYCRKWVSPGHSGVPDRILLYEGHVLFVELKLPGGHPSPLQLHEMTLIRKQGMTGYFVYNKSNVDAVIRELTSWAWWSSARTAP